MDSPGSNAAKPGKDAVDQQEILRFLGAIGRSSGESSLETERKADVVLSIAPNPPPPRGDIELVALSNNPGATLPSTVTAKGQTSNGRSLFRDWAPRSQARPAVRSRLRARIAELMASIKKSRIEILAAIIGIIFLGGVIALAEYVSSWFLAALPGVGLLAKFLSWLWDPERCRVRDENRINLLLGCGLLDSGRIETLYCPRCEKKLRIRIERRTNATHCIDCDCAITLPRQIDFRRR